MKKTVITLIFCVALLFTGCSITINHNGNDQSEKDPKQEASLAESNEETTEEASKGISQAEDSDIPSTEQSNEESVDATSTDEGVESVSDEEKALSEFKLATPSDAILAVAHLGYCEGDYAEICDYLADLGAYEEMPFLKLITEEDFAAFQGGQLYVAIPLSEGSMVVVSEYLVKPENAFQALGEEVVRGEKGMPVLMRGNYSDNFSNMYVATMTETYVEEEYQPTLSLENGSLYIPENNRGVFDFTPYELLGVFDEAWVGEWYGEVDFDGDSRVALFLNLNSDGSMTYACGYVMSEITSSYTGSWTEEGGKLNIAMTDNSEPNGETVTAVFECAVDGDTLYLTHVDGNSLIYGFDGETFVFTSGMMVG